MFVGGGSMFDFLTFLGVTQLPKKGFFLTQSSFKNMFITHFLLKPTHFLKMLIEIRSFLLHKIFKSQNQSWMQYFVSCTNFLQLDTIPNKCIFLVELRPENVLRIQIKFSVRNLAISCLPVCFAMTKDDLEYNVNPSFMLCLKMDC